MMQKTITICSVDVWRTAVTWAVAGIMVGLVTALTAAYSGVVSRNQMLLALVIFVLSPVAGFVTGFVAAIVYNMASFFTGGIRLTIQEGHEGQQAGPADKPPATTNLIGK